MLADLPQPGIVQTIQAGADMTLCRYT